MDRKRLSIDGLVPRRSGAEVGERRGIPTPRSAIPTPRQAIPARRELKSASDLENETIGRFRPERSIARSEIDESLNSLGEEPVVKVSRRARRLRKENPTRAKNKRKAVKIVLGTIGVVILLAGVFIGIKALMATSSVFTGNFFGLFQNQPLKQDANGRSNFLVLGTTDDDPNHPGNTLTDTMMIVSVDQKAKNAYMMSVPRDLYVNYGMACPAGYQGKINNYFECSNGGTSDQAEQDRLARTEKFVGDIFGIDIQYGVHVNSRVLAEAVNAVGGIDVDIKSRDPRGLLDRNFDWACSYTCFKVKYSNGWHHLSGQQATYLTMARGDGGYAAATYGTYGFERSNFDREQNQQMIIQALKVKATSAGILANPGAVTKLLDSIGQNLRTNIDTNEIRTLMDIANKMKSSDIHRVDFMEQTSPVFTTGSMGSAGSVVYPAAGVGNYAALRDFVRRQLSSNPVVREDARVVVLNGTSVAGAAQDNADKLQTVGLNVVDYSNADKDTYKKTVIYQLSKDLPATAKKLASTYGVEVSDQKPPFTVNSKVDFVVVIGLASTNRNQ